MSLKDKLKSILPSPILQSLQRIANYRRRMKEAKLIAQQLELHRQALENVRAKKGPINVVFFALFDSVWKYDTLYQLMEKDDRFNPVILVCPVVNYGKENMLQNMDNCYNLFKSKGYNVRRAYDPDKDKYVDVKKEMQPDVIFYTNPYSSLIDSKYYITQFPDVLTAYVNYYFCAESKNFDKIYDNLFYNLLWKKYVETEHEIEDAIKYARNKGRNMILTGYPGIDNLINPNYSASDKWKIADKNIKRIIWAPHHTIDGYNFIEFSTFLKYSEFFLYLAEKYQDKIQIAFKPHPLLKNRLYIKWGKEKTDIYYSRWANLKNSQLEEGDYVDLFLTSDAIVHDSGSFIYEYLMTGKPAMHLHNQIPYEQQFNDLTQEALSHYYKGENEEDIEKFIIDLVNGKDEKKEDRIKFVQHNLIPPNGKLASENILNDLVESLSVNHI